MNFTTRIAAGVSIVFTTLAFSHVVFHNTMHMLTGHDASRWFIAAHTVVALALTILSLAGAFYLLTSKRRQNPN
ncbi:MAG TPA: hypothetical protein VKQ28_03970 [Candidatus Acidoferrum sp.]|nr:hypothetical protein [Candidatus Acidoferrum sp.]